MVRNKVLALLLLLVFLFLPLQNLQAAGDNRKVYVIKLEGEVEAGLYYFLQRAFTEAAENGASAIIMELNTPGGLVSPAKDIRDLIYDSQVPVYAYVRHNALSAGAFLALSCRKLYMAPGSTIGAAEIQDLSGEAVDEKIISAWEAEMRTAAENQGKDPEVAAAMVRKEITIEGLDDDKQLLTLTTAEAEEIGFVDGVFATRAELLSALDLAGAAVQTVEVSPAERLARFVAKPVGATLLLTIGLTAMVIEIFITGFGAAGVISILAFALYFGGSMIAGFAGKEEVILFILGIILLLIEAFIPNFGVVGVSGIVSIIAAIILSASTAEAGIRIILSSLFLTTAVVAVAFRYLKRSRVWSQIILQYAETKDRGYVAPADYSHLLGKTGQTLTPLRPIGAAEIDGLRIDVVSEGSFIEKAQTVQVVKVEGSRVIVRPQ